MGKTFKILSIDGGGIRGIFPAQFLAEIESQIENDTGKKVNTCDYFDLICGTSTGGILAIALSLGLSASEIADLYLSNSKKIFGRKFFNPFRMNVLSPKHSNDNLESILKNTFSDKFNNEDPIIDNCKTRICIPVYDVKNGQMNVLKTRHHKKLIRDWLIPAYQAAMATSAAPTYFNPYTLNYKGVSDKDIIEKNKVDGGVFANNPVMIGFIEAVSTLNIPINNIKILSIGTGTRKFTISKSSIGWGIARWMWKNRLIDMFMQSQSDVVDNQIKFFNNGIGLSNTSQFYYKRVQHNFRNKKESIKMDEFRKKKLQKLMTIAQSRVKLEGAEIINEFYKETVNSYKNGKL